MMSSMRTKPTALILAVSLIGSAGAATLVTGLAGAAAKKHPLRILVSNDDGVKAPGIDALVQALRKEKNVQVTVVAPATNESGSGGKTTPGTLTATKTTTKSGYPAWAVNGFPADSVHYGLTKVLKKGAVDLVIAGINQGENLGPLVDISGTVGAARAGAQAGIPALATSEGSLTITNFAAGADVTIDWLKANRDHLKKGVVVNLNIPQCSAGKVRGTVKTTSDTAFPAGSNPFVPVDCTQTAGPASDDAGAYLQGFATVSTVSKAPKS
jgi:5'-nucleotidase